VTIAKGGQIIPCAALLRCCAAALLRWSARRAGHNGAPALPAPGEADI